MKSDLSTALYSTDIFKLLKDYFIMEFYVRIIQETQWSKSWEDKLQNKLRKQIRKEEKGAGLGVQLSEQSAYQASTHKAQG